MWMNSSARLNSTFNPLLCHLIIHAHLPGTRVTLETGPKCAEWGLLLPQGVLQWRMKHAWCFVYITGGWPRQVFAALVALEPQGQRPVR